MAQKNKASVESKPTQFFRRHHMSTQKKKTIFVSCLILFILLVAGGLPVGAAAGQALLPEGLMMEEIYKPGRGRSVGRVQRVQGEVVIMHADILKGYRAGRGMRLYKGDTIITLEDSKIRFRLNDRSILSLSSATKLTLNTSVYDKQKKQRSSFLGLAFGKARVLVVKLLDYKRSEFKVKTPTAVCGVRGSDFILEATLDETIATALEDTELELWSLAFLDLEPVILKDGETSRVKKGQKPTPPVKLPADEIARKKQYFMDVEPIEGDTTEEIDTLEGKGGDDTGVDDVAGLGEKQLKLERIERPEEIRVPTPYEEDKPLPKSDLPMFEAAVLEESPVGELPDFPSKP
jgi:hypothetical protein